MGSLPSAQQHFKTISNARAYCTRRCRDSSSSRFHPDAATVWAKREKPMSSLRASYTHDDGEHVAQFAVWHGSESQIMSLLGAVEHNCDCAQGRGGGDNGRSRCAAHVMLAFDQRALDGLLFM